MNKEQINKQRDSFKKKHGEFPVFPVKVDYKYSGVAARGEIKPTSVGGILIFGYPGIIPLLDEHITDLKLISDGEGRKF